MSYYNQVIEAITNSSVPVIKATKYISPKEIIRATRKLWGKKIVKGQNIEITLTIGKPNYAEREMIKLCQKAGETFPIKMVVCKLYNAKKKVLKPKSKKQHDK